MARMIFNDAAEDVKKFRLGGKKDFRLPSKNELNVLFENRNKGALHPHRPLKPEHICH